MSTHVYFLVIKPREPQVGSPHPAEFRPIDFLEITCRRRIVVDDWHPPLLSPVHTAQLDTFGPRRDIHTSTQSQK